MPKEREYLFDNIKALLIILVVFGHCIEYFELQNEFLKINEIIYMFHMPFFIFVSGYFSKNFKDQEKKAIRNFLIPFFVFNTLYILYYNFLYPQFADKTINIFLPMYGYWYLLSLFIWKILLKYVVKFKYSFILICLVSLYIGVIDQAERFLSISRTLSFFPFFLLGYYTQKEHINKIRKISKKIIIPLFVILLVIIYILSENIGIFELLKNAQSYHFSKVSNKVGMFVRILQILLSIGISMCIINLMSEKNNWMSSIGQKTITIYLLSPFIQHYLSIFINNINITNNVIMMGICIISTAIIVIILSRDVIYNTYNKFINWIYEIITIKDENME